MPSKEDKLGAMWVKQSSRGEYFSGQIEINGSKHDVVVFPNGYKTADNHPDFIVYRSRPKGSR